MVDNHLNEFYRKIAAGEVCLGSIITLNDLTVSELAGDVGFDFIWIDAEHAPHTIDGVMQHIIAARAGGCAPFVRVRNNDPMLMKPYLDLAPAGIIVPMVNSAEEAQKAVEACRYPPVGKRGCGVRRAVAYGTCDFQDYLRESAANPLLIIQIEHVDAVRNLDRILEVPGVDSICIGPCDLSGSMGILDQTEDPELNRVIDEICQKTKKAGKLLGTASDNFPRWKARGVDWFAGAVDWGSMAEGFRKFIASCHL